MIIITVFQSLLLMFILSVAIIFLFYHKVIFMSGHTENIIAHHGVLEYGINYISKPITPAALTKKLKVYYTNDGI